MSDQEVKDDRENQAKAAIALDVVEALVESYQWSVGEKLRLRVAIEEQCPNTMKGLVQELGFDALRPVAREAEEEGLDRGSGPVLAGKDHMGFLEDLARSWKTARSASGLKLSTGMVPICYLPSPFTLHLCRGIAVPHCQALTNAMRHSQKPMTAVLRRFLPFGLRPSLLLSCFLGYSPTQSAAPPLWSL